MSIKKPVFIAALVAGVLSGSAVGYIFASYSELPDIHLLQEFRPPVVTKIYSDDNRLIGELFQEKRELLSYDEIPQDAIDAVLATEDARFFEHRGVRVLSILRAVIADIRAGRFVQGGSTITQQLAKTLFLTSEKTFSRKFKEMLIALQLEINYTKREILSLYFNQIYFGEGSYGITAAAQVYFNKKTSELTLAECALIGGLPRAPSYYSPYNDIERTRKRRSVVLKRMLEEKLINIEQKKEAEAEAITLVPRSSLPEAPYFLEMVRRKLEKKYGSDLLYRQGLKVYTTLNIEMQEAAREAVKSGIQKVEARIAKRKKEEDRVPVQAALVAIEPSSGEIKAMVGGRDFAESPFNRAVQAKRQPGSAFKPIYFAAALEEGWTPAGILIDSPVILKDPSRPGDWKPTNYSKKFYGPVTLRKALEKSLNVASVKLIQEIGIDKAISFAHKLGIQSKLHPYPSLALGGSEVSLIELTGAYAVFANLGLKPELSMIRSIKKHDGQTLEKSNKAVAEVMSAQNAYLMSKMLEGVIQNGTGKVAKKLKSHAGAKTGTTDNFTDAWFVGISPRLATGVWVGHDMKLSLGRYETGAKAAGPIWTQFMISALKDVPVRDFEKPDKIIEMDIDRATGLLPDSKCGEVSRESFIIGTEPTVSCRKKRP